MATEKSPLPIYLLEKKSMYIIAGLGNPGDKYAQTRHNMGFRVIDKLADDLSVNVTKAKFKSLIGECSIGMHKVLLVKPQTYMNLSGDALREVSNFYKVPSDNVIVIYDDIDIPLGSIRIRKFGGPGTHNGMRSIVSQLGTTDFPRIRTGVGGNEGSLVDHVIGKVSKDENEILNETAVKAAKAAKDIIEVGIEKAMNLNNTTKKKG